MNTNTTNPGGSMIHQVLAVTARSENAPPLSRDPRAHGRSGALVLGEYPAERMARRSGGLRQVPNRAEAVRYGTRRI